MLDSQFWAKYFRVYDTLNQLIPYQDLLDLFLEKLDLLVSGGKNILDVGSGTGNLCIKLKKNGYHPTGIDFSKEGIALFKQKDSTAKVFYGDITQSLPFDDDSFDGVCTNNTVYTLPEEKRPLVFKEFYRVLKPNGVIIVSNLVEGFSPVAVYLTHIKESLKNKGLISTLADLVHFFIPTVKIFYYNFLIKKEHMGGAYSFLTESKQRNLLEGAGFSVLGEARVYGNQAIFTWAKK